jgi:hypothetical protein
LRKYSNATNAPKPFAEKATSYSIGRFIPVNDRLNVTYVPKHLKVRVI